MSSREVSKEMNMSNCFHSPRSGNVFDPEVVEDDVRDLDHLYTIDAFEDREEQRNLLYHQEFLLRANDIYSIANIKWVLDEEENTGGEEFLGCSSEDKRQGEQSCSSSSKCCYKVGVLESDCGMLI